jgi:hypothetical protein
LFFLFAIGITAIFRLSGSSQKEVPEEEELRRRVDALSEQGFGWASLGVPDPTRTEDVDYIVRQGRKAVPLLIEALKSGDDVKVGYAAFCLELMKSPEGLDTAKHRLAAIARTEESNWKKTFARNCLEQYLEVE